MVKKIADEHGARVRIANLGAGGDGEGAEGLALGAQVSLSFAKFAPVAGTPLSTAPPIPSAH